MVAYTNCYRGQRIFSLFLKMKANTVALFWRRVLKRREAENQAPRYKKNRSF
jgi:hypothetical protein